MVKDITILRVWFDDYRIFIETSVGEIKSDLLAKYPRLFKASDKDKQNFELSPFGIHWESIDEDLSFDGFFYSENNEYKDIA